MYQCHTFSYRILMVCIYLVRSNTEFTRFLSPFVPTEVFSRYGTNLAGICFRYDVGGIYWYPVANIKHGWIEISHRITRNLLTDVCDVRVVLSESRWRLVASDKLFVAIQDGFWDHRSSWSDQLNFVLNTRSIILVQLFTFYFTVDVTWWFGKKYEFKRAALLSCIMDKNFAYFPAFWSNCIKMSWVIKRKNMFLHWIEYFKCSVSGTCFSKVPKLLGYHNSLKFATPRL